MSPMGYLCDNHPDTPASVAVTNIETGDVVALCAPDVHPWFAAMAEATRPAPEPEAAAESPDEVTGDPTHDDSAGSPGPTPEPGGPALSPAPEVEPETDPEVGDDLPGVADLLEAARPHLADDLERATSDA